MEIAVVDRGDSVDSIASRFQIPVERLIRDNQLNYPYRLAVGQALLVRTEDSLWTAGDGSPSITAMGYAYPFIKEDVLLNTLPFLSEVFVFSYRFTTEGELSAPDYEVDGLLSQLQRFGKGAVLVLTPIGPGGHFDGRLVSLLLENEGAEEKLLSQIEEEIKARGYMGLDIDFEGIPEVDRERFSNFVLQARIRLNALGYRVSAALAPKLSASQPGLLYEGIDYRALGQAANQVMLMTYEWGYSLGVPMAVAPIHMVRRVAEYAVSEIPGEKILLGIPNYGYDWALPYVAGVTRARSLGSLEAMELAADKGAVIQFDAQSQSPWFHYWEGTVQHEVWFEDVRSLLAKFRLIRELGLRGAGYWQLMRFFRAGWLLLNHEFRVEGAGPLTGGQKPLFTA